MSTTKTRFHASAEDFKKIPGSPVAYWVSDAMRTAFSTLPPLGSVAPCKQGIATADNDRFLRLWFEVSDSDISFGLESQKEADVRNVEWIPYNKGGPYRKWYGNQEYVICWTNNGFAIRNFFGNDGKPRSAIRNEEYFYLPSCTWSDIATTCFGARYTSGGTLFDGSGHSCFPQREDEALILSLLCSKVSTRFLRVINPTMHFQVGNVAMLPLLKTEVPNERINDGFPLLVSIARHDWDAYERSWDFATNPLVTLCDSLRPLRSLCQQPQAESSNPVNPVSPVESGAAGVRALPELYATVREKWAENCEEMRRLETENNRIFIEAYGLQDELTPEVPWHEITLTCNPWYRYGAKEVEKVGGGGEDGGRGATALPRDAELEARLRTDTIKELVSYAIGCLMGRYSLDKEGLILASQGETIEDYWEKLGIRNEELGMTGGALGDRALPSSSSIPHSSFLIPHSFEPDDDGIIPLIAGANAFTDNGPKRVVDFVRAAFGVEHLSENLNFIEECLGGTLEQYLVKDFWKDHKKTYQNRPIYWLFASKKGAFQCLVYMHRMDAYTVSKIRNDYLLPHIEFLRNRIAADSTRGAELTAKERTALKKMQQAETECLEYDERLHVVADRMQAIDLDDGVIVNYAKFGDVVAKIK